MKSVTPKTSEEFTVFDKFYHEINLLRIEGYYFVLDPKQAKRDKKPKSFVQKIRTPEKILEKPISVEPNPNYGWPSVLAYKILQAILKKVSENHFTDIVHLSKRELLKLVGRESYGGSALAQLHTAIKQLSNTEIECGFYDRHEKKWAAQTFRIINKEMFSGEKGEIQNCWVKLDELIINSLKANHYFCLSYERLKKLPPISSILYKRLFYHFSNIYSKNQKRDFRFHKDYIDVCETWLGLKSRRYKAEIVRQFEVHFENIKKTQLVEKIEIEKNQEKNGFNLIFSPGPSFFADYDRFYTQEKQLEFNFDGIAEYHANVDPAEAISSFYKSLHNVDDWEQTLIPETDISYAKELLDHHSLDEIKEFITYAVKEASKTRFNMKRFTALRTFQGEYFAKLQTRKKRQQKLLNQKKLQAQKAKKEKEHQRNRQAYDEYLQAKAAEVKKTLSQDKLEEIKHELLKKNKILLQMPTQLDNMLNAKLAELSHPLPFEEWLKTASATQNRGMAFESRNHGF